MTENNKRESAQQELQHLISWIRDNTQEWYYLCHPESYDEDITGLLKLVRSLYQEKLYSVIFFAIYSQSYTTEIEQALDKTIYDCFLDTPVELLMKRFCENLENAAKIKEENTEQ